MMEWILIERGCQTRFEKGSYILCYIDFFAGARWRLYKNGTYTSCRIATMDANQEAEQEAQVWADQIIKEREAPEMTTITTTKENILKTHKEGCSATKKALENLYPEVFKKEERELPAIQIVFILAEENNLTLYHKDAKHLFRCGWGLADGDRGDARELATKFGIVDHWNWYGWWEGKFGRGSDFQGKA